METTPPRARPQPWRTAAIAAAFACAAAVAAWHLASRRYLDHDIFHQMALWRAALDLGRIPTENIFSYTPSIPKVVHHEWGTGAILYHLAMLGGGTALGILRIALLAAVILLATLSARLRGAGWVLIAPMGLLAAPLMSLALSPVRANLFTLAFTAALMVFMELDRRGRRAWILAFFPLYLLWLNIHGGFAAGCVLIALHWVERVIRTRRPQWHLVGLGIAMALGMLINPYGPSYITYMWDALTMPRPTIKEWQPIWMTPRLAGYFFATIVLVGYASAERGLRPMHGLLPLLFITFEALQHVRHITLYSVVWLACAPAFLAGTRLDTALNSMWQRRPAFFAVFYAALTLTFASATPASPWRLQLPTSSSNSRNLIMPVGAVAYLQEQGFRGNVMTPFNGGAYVMWRLYPAVRVGMDSRYEAAYPPEVYADVRRLYKAEPGWEQVLDQYPTDLLLARNSEAICTAIASRPQWRMVYIDDEYSIFARAGITLPRVDRRGEPLEAGFP